MGGNGRGKVQVLGVRFERTGSFGFSRDIHDSFPKLGVHFEGLHNEDHNIFGGLFWSPCLGAQTYGKHEGPAKVGICRQDGGPFRKGSIDYGSFGGPIKVVVL